MKMRLAICLLTLLINHPAPHQQATVNRPDTNFQGATSECTDSKINNLVLDILKRGEGRTASGIRTTTWVPPSGQDDAKIKNCGEKAIEPLSRFLDSDEPRAQLLAVRLLGVVGGPKIVQVLVRALEPNRWVVVRTQAMSSLMSGPKEAAIAVIRKDLTQDFDPQVQARGKLILQSLGGE